MKIYICNLKRQAGCQLQVIIIPPKEGELLEFICAKNLSREDSALGYGCRISLPGAETCVYREEYQTIIVDDFEALSKVFPASEGENKRIRPHGFCLAKECQYMTETRCTFTEGKCFYTGLPEPDGCQHLDNVGGCIKTVGHKKCTCLIKGKING